MPLPWNTSDRQNGEEEGEKTPILFVLNNELA
jgi:hypothetical protein